MAQLVLSLFGPFHARLDDQPLHNLRSARIQSLLAYLVLEPGRKHSRDLLAAHFWPDESDEVAKQNLRQALYQLRQRVEDDQSTSPFLLLTRDSVEFNRESNYQLDVALFQEYLQQQRFAEAVALYRGELLAELRSDSDRVEEWLIVQRTHFHLLTLDALQKLTEQELAQGNPAKAQEYARRQLALEPWRELAHRQLMIALAAAGDRTGALAHYETCQRLLQSELGVEPEATTRMLFEQIRSQVPELAPQSVLPQSTPVPVIPANSDPHTATEPHDWGDIPEVVLLQGREQEIGQLEGWLLRDRCRLVTIVGMGGMGKTTLTARAARQFSAHFDIVIWKSLINAPPLSEILRSWLAFLSAQPVAAHEPNLDTTLTQLFTILRQRRCLLVLDNVESILQGDTRAGHYHPGYEAYGQLFKRIGETNHRSSLLLTSRETPQEVARLERESSAVRILPLAGLSHQAGLAILRRQGIALSTNANQQVVERYSGNPLALMLVADTIHDLFAGDADAFLHEDAAIFDDIRDVLDQQFSRLTSLEQDILLWLAIEREPIGVTQLGTNLQPAVPTRLLIEALNSLRRRSLVEKSGEEKAEGRDRSSTGFMLQNVVTEYLTDHFLERICAEVEELAPRLFKSHTLLNAQAKEYVRQSQTRLIVQPIAERLRAKFGPDRLAVQLKALLAQLRSDADRNTNYGVRHYGGGNLFNLLMQLAIDPARFDFSHLAIWQAYLAGAAAPNVNFSGCNFKNSVFSDKFGAMIAVAFSPNGEQIAAGSSVGNIRLWRVSDGQSLGMWHAHDNYIFSLLFSPDGNTLYSCSDDQSIRLWELDTIDSDEETPVPLRLSLGGHQRGVWRIALSRDGRLLASAGGDGQVILWDAQDGRQLASHRTHKRGVRAIAMHPSGKWIVSGDEGGVIRLWEQASGEIWTIPAAHSAGILSLAFAPNGQCFASGSYDSGIRIWDMAAIRARSADETTPIDSLLLRNGHQDRVTNLAFSSDGRLLASSSKDQSIRLWEVATGEVRHILREHSDAIAGIAFNHNDTILASGSEDRSVRLWEVARGHALRTIYGHAQGVMAISRSADGCLLASAHQDHKVRIWDLQNNALQTILPIHQKEVASVAFQPHGDLLASGSVDQTIQLWDVRKGRVQRTLRGHTGWVRMITFSHDGKQLISCSNDYSLRLWDVQSGTLLRTLKMNFSVWAAAQSPDSKRFVCGGTTGLVQLWDFASGELIMTLHGHSNWVTTVAFSPDGKLIASGSGDQLVFLWDAQSGERLHILNGHSSWVYAVAFSPDGKWIASASADQTVCLWNVETQQRHYRLLGHQNEVRSLVFSRDSATLFSASTDDTVRCWDVTTGICQTILHAPRPYEGMDITGATGITAAQRRSLISLGAVEREEGVTG